MPGKISSITNFGAFVTLDDVYVDGLIHISELGQDYFEFDEASYSLRGRSSGAVYRLQDPIKVQIAGVDSDTRRVDFVLVREDGSKGNTRRGKVQPTAESERKRTTSAKSRTAAPEKPVGRSSRQRGKR